MTDQIVRNLRASGIYPDTKYASQLLENATRSEKVSYCRKFYRESAVYRMIVDRLCHLVGSVTAITNSSIITGGFIDRVLREYLITGEAIVYTPSRNVKQILESERVDITTEGDSITKIIYDDEFEISPDVIHILANTLRVSNFRGEPPLAVILPWIIRCTTLLNVQLRAADIATRMLARVVSTLSDDPEPEFDFQDEVVIMRTSSTTDLIDYPKYSPPDLTNQIEGIYKIIAGLVGVPKEVLFSDYGNMSFSGAKASFYSFFPVVDTYRRLVFNFLREIEPSIFVQWGTYPTPADLEMAKSESIRNEAGEN